MVATLAVEAATDMVEGVTEGVEDIGVTKMKVVMVEDMLGAVEAGDTEVVVEDTKPSIIALAPAPFELL